MDVAKSEPSQYHVCAITCLSSSKERMYHMNGVPEIVEYSNMEVAYPELKAVD